MKKFAVLLFAPLFLLPAFAACHTSAPIETDAPALSPAPQIPDPVPPISDPIPQISEQPQERVDPPQEHEVSPQKEATLSYILVLADGLNVRSGAGVSFPSLGQAQRGTLLLYDGMEGGWYRTLYRGGTAYVSADERYTALSEMETGGEQVEEVIAAGMSLLGVPYVYGATRFHDGKGNLLKGFSADAFDCSSLMQYIFYRADVLLDVTTRTQIKQGIHVEKADLRRGDLMFFTNASRRNKTGLERVGHVAVYLGDNYILHTSSDFAKVEQISARRWEDLIGSRRVL